VKRPQKPKHCFELHIRTSEVTDQRGRTHPPGFYVVHTFSGAQMVGPFASEHDARGTILQLEHFAPQWPEGPTPGHLQEQLGGDLVAWLRYLSQGCRAQVESPPDKREPLRHFPHWKWGANWRDSVPGEVGYALRSLAAGRKEGRAG